MTAASTATAVGAMTESSRKRSRARNAFSVYAATAALFVTVGGFLGVRMSHGQDPALGQFSAQATQAVAADGTTAGRATTASGTPLQTRTSGGSTSATQPAGRTPAAAHNTTSAKKKLQTRTSGHGGHHHDGSESHDA